MSAFLLLPQPPDSTSTSGPQDTHRDAFSIPKLINPFMRFVSQNIRRETSVAVSVTPSPPSFPFFAQIIEARNILALLGY